MSMVGKIQSGSLSDKMASVGNNLSVAASVIKYLDVSIDDSTNYTKADLMNLIVVLKTLINTIISDYAEIEQVLDV